MKKLIVFAAMLSLVVSARAFCEQPMIEEYDIKDSPSEKVSSKPQDGVEYEVQKALKAQANYEDAEGPSVIEATPKTKTTKVSTKTAATETPSSTISEEPVIIEKVAKPKKTAVTPKATLPKKTLAVTPPKAEKRKMLEVETIETSASAGEVKEVKVSIKKDIKLAPAFDKNQREGSFRGGLIGPGFYYGNKSIGSMMGIGLEGEYFFLENLSAGLHAQIATDFKSNSGINSVLSFIPQARYYFDFDNHPRISAFVQAGIGYGLLDGKHSVADIAIPGGGIEWLYNANFAIGFEASLHILARSNTAISVFAGPTFRYQF